MKSTKILRTPLEEIFFKLTDMPLFRDDASLIDLIIKQDPEIPFELKECSPEEVIRPFKRIRKAVHDPLNIHIPQLIKNEYAVVSGWKTLYSGDLKKIPSSDQLYRALICHIHWYKATAAVIHDANNIPLEKVYAALLEEQSIVFQKVNDLNSLNYPLEETTTYLAALPQPIRNNIIEYFLNQYVYNNPFEIKLYNHSSLPNEYQGLITYETYKEGSPTYSTYYKETIDYQLKYPTNFKNPLTTQDLDTLAGENNAETIEKLRISFDKHPIENHFAFHKEEIMLKLLGEK